MPLDNSLLQMVARGGQSVVPAMYERGLRTGNALRDMQFAQEDRAANQRITNALAEFGVPGAIEAGASSSDPSLLMRLANMHQQQQNRVADRDFRREQFNVTNDFRNQQFGLRRQQIAQSRQQQDPRRTYLAREQAAEQFGLQPGTPEFQSFVLTGSLPKPAGAAAAKPTVDSAKAAGFFDRMQAAEAVIGSQGATDAARSRVQRGLHQMPFGNEMVSEDFQRFDQARRDFVNAILRRESGAVISDAEFENAARQYFPQPGDSEAVIAQKAQNRRIAIEGVRRAGQPSLGAQPQQTAAQWQDVGNGVRIRRVDGGGQQAQLRLPLPGLPPPSEEQGLPPPPQQGGFSAAFKRGQ